MRNTSLQTGPGGNTLWKRRAILACGELLISIVAPFSLAIPSGDLWWLFGVELFPNPFVGYIFALIFSIISSSTWAAVEQDEPVPRSAKIVAQSGVFFSLLINSILTILGFLSTIHGAFIIPIVPLLETPVVLYHGYITFQLPHCKAEDFRRMSFPKLNE